MKNNFALFILLTSAGCASGELASFEKFKAPEPTIARFAGANPKIGVVSTASVGQIIFEDFNYVSKTEPSHYRIGETINVNLAPAMNVNATPDTKLFKLSPSKFCIDNYGHDCLYDDDLDNKFERASTQPGLIRFEKPLEKPIEYFETAGERTITDTGGYRRELIYQGRDGGTLRVKYREFSDNLARAAFSQDLTYPIKASNKSEIVFQNVKIVVHTVSDTEINYTVESDNF